MISVNDVLLRVKAGIERVSGAPAVFTIESGGVYTPNPDSDATSNVTGKTATQVSVTVSPPVSYRQVYPRADATLKASSSIVYLPAAGLTFVPALGMRFTQNGITWVIAEITPQTLKDTVILYELEVHGG